MEIQALIALRGGNLHLPSVILAAHEPLQENSLNPFKSSLAAALLALAATAAHAQQQVVIVTSFPKELTEAYKKAFEAKNPGIKVEILNKPTPAGVAYIREAPASN